MFLIASGKLPEINHGGQASKDCLAFIKACTIGESEERPSAKDLLKHPFLTGACSSSVMATLLEKTYALESAQAEEEGDEEDEEEGEAEEAGSQPAPASTTSSQGANGANTTTTTTTTTTTPPPPPPQSSSAPFGSGHIGMHQNPGHRSVVYDGKAELEDNEEEETVGGTIIISARKMTARPPVGRTVSPPIP